MRVFKKHIWTHCSFAALAFMMLAENGYGADLYATSVTESSSQYTIPPNSFFGPVSTASDGITTTSPSYGLMNPDSSYVITYGFAPTSSQALTAVKVWSNGGNYYNDAELRSFNLAIDYLDVNGNPQTLTMNNVNLTDTASSTDVKTVDIVDGAGNPVELLGVSEIRMSNLGSGGTGDVVWREFQGSFVEVSNDLVTTNVLKYGNATPNATEQVGYTVTVTNNGTDTANNITLTDKLPTGITAGSGNGVVSAGTYDSSTGLWSIPSLAAGASATLTLIGHVDSGQEGNTIINSTTAADNLVNDETNTSGDQLSVSMSVDAISKVTQTSSHGLLINSACHTDLSLVSDGDITNTNGYCISSPVDPSYQLEIKETPPSGQYLESISIWANAGNAFTDGELRTFDLYIDYIDFAGTPQTLVMNNVNIGDTASGGDVKTVTLVDSNNNPIILPNVSKIRLGNLSSAGTGEVAIREIQGNYDIPNVDVDLVTVNAITSNANFPSVGDTATFTITVTNNGADAAPNVSLSDLLPAGLTATANNGSVTAGSYNAGTGEWIIPSLAGNGSSATLTLEGTINAGANGTTITNTTTAALSEFNDPTDTAGDVLSQQFTVSDPKLIVQKVADKTVNVGSGETITYTYTVTNTGNVPISNINLSDTHNASGAPPTPTDETLDNDVSPLADSADADDQDNIWDLLAPGDSIKFTGTYQVSQQDIEALQ